MAFTHLRYAGGQFLDGMVIKPDRIRLIRIIDRLMMLEKNNGFLYV